jgi:hypothetical protein
MMDAMSGLSWRLRLVLGTARALRTLSRRPTRRPTRADVMGMPQPELEAWVRSLGIGAATPIDRAGLEGAQDTARSPRHA